MDGADIDPRLAVARVVFVVLAQPPIAAQPAEVRSTIQRLGRWTYPLTPIGRRIVVSTQPNFSWTHSTTAVYAPSAQITRSRGNAPAHAPTASSPRPSPARRPAGPPAPRSAPGCQPAGAACGRRSFFPASYPLGPPASVVLTDWLSMMPALGVGFPARPAPDIPRRAAWIRSQIPRPARCRSSRRRSSTAGSRAAASARRSRCGPGRRRR